MNILVTGANGQLGSELRLVAQHSKDRYIFTDVEIGRASCRERVYVLV